MGEKKWQGIGVSSGCAAGKPWVLKSDYTPNIDSSRVGAGSETERQRLEKAIQLTDAKLGSYEAKVLAEKGEEFAGIFSAQRLMLSDPSFTGEMFSLIANEGRSAESALETATAQAVLMLEELDAPYFRDRIPDILDVAHEIRTRLLGNEYDLSCHFPEEGKWIVIAEELTPAQTVALPKDRVQAVIVMKGGQNSHAAILARTYAIPAIIGVKASVEELASEAGLELSGDEGWIRSLGQSELQVALLNNEQACDDLCGEVFPDESTVILAANIGDLDDLPLVKRFKARGIGLFRTELMYMASKLPTEDEQVAVYSEVIKTCSPHLTIIRTLDIGGDKKAPAIDLPIEKNPMLGIRALRLCIRMPELFETQLRAIWRASAYGPAAVMFPMIATYEELTLAREFLFRAREQVVCAGFEVGYLKVGVMIEVPAAVWLADRIAKEVDFFSIGTNDLTQYALAVDRENHNIADLYQTYNPAVLGMVAHVAQAGERAGIWTGICGEAAGDKLLAPFFVSLGIRELSMAPGLLPGVRSALAGFKVSEDTKKELVDRVLACNTAAEVSALLKFINQTYILR